MCVCPVWIFEMVQHIWAQKSLGVLKLRVTLALLRLG